MRLPETRLEITATYVLVIAVSTLLWWLLFKGASVAFSEEENPYDIYDSKHQEKDITIHVGGPRVTSDDGDQYVNDRLQRQLDRDAEFWRQQEENSYRQLEMINDILHRRHD